MIAVGLMCGTSLDGIDAALVEIVPSGDRYTVDLRAFVTVPLSQEFERRLRAAFPPHGTSAAEVATLHRACGVEFAHAARQVAGATRVDYVASHGITLFHDGSAHITFQIGDPTPIRETLATTVCYDFRSADCAAGGHGAPLVPYADALLLVDAREYRAALNIGGIANVTYLPPDAQAHDVLAFDTGPGNMLIDAYVRARTSGDETYDRGGSRARRGRSDADIVARLLADPYFAAEPPKSTGRERFDLRFLDGIRAQLDAMPLDDALATLTDVTVTSIASAVRSFGRCDRVLVSGGGARNAAMLEGLERRLPEVAIATTAMAGVDPDAKEALAFALLGYETLRGRAANVPRVTGASRPVPLGSLLPHDLGRILLEMERECRYSSV